MSAFEHRSTETESSKDSTDQIDTSATSSAVASPPRDTNQSGAAAAYDAPPNGGRLAWLQVVGSFFLFFNSWGIVNAFGVFQTYYGASFPNESPSNISWIGSIQAFLVLVIGVLVGPLYDAGFFKALIVAGGVLIVLGLMLTSLCSQYWQVLLAQGFMVGIGAGCLYIPSVAIIPQYFSSRKAVATGIAATGSSIGSMIYPIVFHQLQPRVGFGWATRVLAFIALATVVVSVVVMRDRHSQKKARSLLELPAFREPPYTLFCSAMFFGYMGFFTPLFYIESYAISSGVANQIPVFYLLPILNAASVPGRIVPGLIARYTGPLNVLLTAATEAGILSICWIAIHNAAGIVVFALLYGFFSGSFVSLLAVSMVSLTPDLSRLGTRMGMCNVICGVGSLCGSPVAGAILNSTGHYLGAQLFSGLASLTAGILLVAARLAKAGFKFKVVV